MTSKQVQRLAETGPRQGTPPEVQYEIMVHRVSSDEPVTLTAGWIPFAAVQEGTRLSVLLYREII